MSQLHQRPRSEASMSDEWDTRNDFYMKLCSTYDIYPNIDICATERNKKCSIYIDKETNALLVKSLDEYKRKEEPNGETVVFCNPPQKFAEKFVRLCHYQWLQDNITIMMIIPATSLCTKYSRECIVGSAYYEPLVKTETHFLNNGNDWYVNFKGEIKKVTNPRNGYFVVIWRKRS